MKTKSKAGRAASPQKSKAKNAKADRAAPKPRKTAEQLSDEERQTLLFNHKRKLKPLLEAEKNAKAAVTKAFELAKKEGVTKKQIQLAIQLETEEGQEKLRNQIAGLLDVDRWNGRAVGTQLELFEKQSVKQRNIDAGKLAALNGDERRLPYGMPQGTAAANDWLSGYGEGLAQLNRQRADAIAGGGGFQQLGDAAPKKIGDAPQTHQDDSEEQREAA